MNDDLLLQNIGDYFLEQLGYKSIKDGWYKVGLLNHFGGSYLRRNISNHRCIEINDKMVSPLLMKEKPRYTLLVVNTGVIPAKVEKEYVLDPNLSPEENYTLNMMYEL